jgi:hypothetical protein
MAGDGVRESGRLKDMAERKNVFLGKTTCQGTGYSIRV